jgi:hypothetical protein
MKGFFKYASLLAAAAMLSFSCGDPVGPVEDGEEDVVNGTLTLSADKQIIQANGKDASTLVVKLDGKVIDKDVVFYNSKDNSIVDIKDFKFVTSEAGEYSLWAEYKTLMTNDVKITAVATEVPETPADPQPSSTSFVRRLLLTQFTGAECGNCPLMKAGLQEAFKDEALHSKIVKADIHNYTAQDPAYMAFSYQPASGWPTCIVDWAVTFGAYQSIALTSKTATAVINERYDASEAKAGIAVNAKYADGVIAVKTVVKAAETGKYRVGVWVLEDGIKGQQADQYNVKEPWMDIFDNSVRLADSKVTGSNYTGHLLGEIKAGQTAERMFVLNLKKSWVVENLKLVVFVSAEDDGSYTVNNAINAPIDGIVQFEYK